MSKLEQALLRNLLDSLDRLFDRTNRVADVRDLLYATRAALAETSHVPFFDTPLEKLDSIVGTAQWPDPKRDTALQAADELRKYLAAAIK
ncbi:MAG: hypothetical protein AAF497_16290 [Planctomycetota bacterium]